MTKFNPDNKGTLTYSESLGPAMKISDPEDDQWQLTEPQIKHDCINGPRGRIEEPNAEVRQLPSQETEDKD